MCLTTVTPKRKWPKPYEGEIFAWKVFDTDDVFVRITSQTQVRRRMLYFPTRWFEYSATCPQRRWLTATNVYIKAGQYVQLPSGGWYIPRYRSGFHAYATERDARIAAGVSHRSIVVRVKLRKVVAVGTQILGGNFAPAATLVAKRMYVPRQRRKP